MHVFGLATTAAPPPPPPPQPPTPTLSFHAKPSEDIVAHLLHAGNKIRWAAPRRRKGAVPSET